MSSGFIIVERDRNLKDCGVFTGQVQVVDYHLHHWDEERELPMQGMDGISSPDIEHAFLFSAAWTAWRFAMQFEPHWDIEQRRYLGHRRWEARKDGDYFPGECRHGLAARNSSIHGKHWIPQEAIIAAAAEGFVQGQESARRELGASR